MLTIYAIIFCYLFGTGLFTLSKLKDNDPAVPFIVIQLIICGVALIFIVICALSGYQIQVRQ